MNKDCHKENLNWLSAVYEARGRRISALLLRLRGLAARVTSASLHKKFLRLLDQVAEEREKEIEILNRIEAVEKRHHEMRRRRLLKHAAMEENEKRYRHRKKENGEIGEEQSLSLEEKRRAGPGEVVMLYLLFCSRTLLFTRLFSRRKLEEEGPVVR